QTFYDDMWRSTDSGQAWTRLTFGDVTGGDKQWFTIDTTNGTGHGFQYQAWSTGGNNWGGRQFSRSTDSGVTWMSPIFIPNSPVFGTLDVASNGNVFIGGASNFTSPFWCIRSTDAQNPGVTPTFDQSTQVDLGGSLVFGGAINPGGLAGQSFLVIDRSGGPTNNNIYMLASVEPFSGGGTDVMFARSTDGGQSFSAPQRINDDPVNPNKWHWFGTLAVAPNGRIDSIWFDTRNAANNTDSQLFYSYSTDGGVTWAPNVAVSSSFTPLEGWPQQSKMGGYITVVSDNTGGGVAYSGSCNFKTSRRQHEPDVYFVHVEPSVGPTPTPTPVPVRVRLTVAPTQINEGQSATYTVSAFSAVSQSITVGYAMSGTATPGTDYALNGTPNQVTIPAGQSSATVTLKARLDHVTEGTETAIMTLQPGSGYILGNPKQATISILDSP